MKTHRVGSFTFGCVLLATGILMLVHMVYPALSYYNIFRLWPVVFIVLGTEVFVANFRSSKTEFRYDMPAIFLILLVLVFAMCLACIACSAEYGLTAFR